MAFLEQLQKLIKEAHCPIYVCTNPDCKNSVGDPSYEEVFGTDLANAPSVIVCTGCGSDMNKEN
jgi:hypothetical protein